MGLSRHSACDRLRHLRRLGALVVVAWLQLLLQPALAQTPAMPADMDCHHAGDCPAILTADCTADQPFVAATGHAPPASHVAPLLVISPADALARPADALRAATLQPPATGPPLIIRFGHLRN